MELDSRKQKILKAIIEEYTRTGEPVGSKRISALLDIVASPATIRNDMAILFEMGLLEQLTPRRAGCPRTWATGTTSTI